MLVHTSMYWSFATYSLLLIHCYLFFIHKLIMLVHNLMYPKSLGGIVWKSKPMCERWPSQWSLGWFQLPLARNGSLTHEKCRDYICTFSFIQSLLYVYVPCGSCISRFHVLGCRDFAVHIVLLLLQ